MRPGAGRTLHALAFAAGMAAFALCAHRPALWAPRLTGLAVAVAALARGLAKAPRPGTLLALGRFPAYRLAYLPLAAALGVALAVWYRQARGAPPLPPRLTWFCALAAGIGLCEELAYRGFLQGCLTGRGPVIAAVAAAAAHTAYKLCLFVLPDVPVRVNLTVLAAGTLLVGIVFGLMREVFGSVLFPVLAHVAFDVAAYGDLDAAPWWVT